MQTEKTIQEVSEKVKRAAYIFMCSYKTAWNYLDEMSTGSFSLEEVLNYIENGGK